MLKGILSYTPLELKWVTVLFVQNEGMKMALGNSGSITMMKKTAEKGRFNIKSFDEQFRLFNGISLIWDLKD